MLSEIRRRFQGNLQLRLEAGGRRDRGKASSAREKKFLKRCTDCKLDAMAEARIKTMISVYEVSETNKMIEQENLDVRTITLGISLMDCIDSDLNELNRKIYEKITVTAKDLVSDRKRY